MTISLSVPVAVSLMSVLFSVFTCWVFFSFSLLCFRYHRDERVPDLEFKFQSSIRRCFTEKLFWKFSGNHLQWSPFLAFSVKFCKNIWRSYTANNCRLTSRHDSFLARLEFVFRFINVIHQCLWIHTNFLAQKELSKIEMVIMNIFLISELSQ